MPSRPRIEYTASPTGWAMHQSDDFVRGLIGPVGSGKSVACCWELWRRANEQTPGPDKVRRSRWLIVRNTYRELQDTTLQTWRDWFPPSLVGAWSEKDMMHTVDVFLDDDTRLTAEFLFRALDRPDDIKKLLSLELTGAWINEAREVPKPVLDMLQSRVGRYPAQRDGGPSWIGIILDTNPPDTDHWWYRLFEEERPEGWQIFHQPSGKSPAAENIENLPPGYYDRLMTGHDQAWIDVYVHGQYGFVKDGKPVYPEYVDNVHALAREPRVVAREIYVGIDFGLTPAAVIAQQTAAGQWQALDEVVTEDMGAVRFAEILGAKLRQEYAGKRLFIYGDPAGDQRSQVDERTPFKVLNAAGVAAVKAPTNDYTLRRESVASLLTSLTMTGVPRLVLSPRCKQLRKAMAGGYKFRRLQVGGEERYTDQPDKNRYSHVAEALQYLTVGAGESNDLVAGVDPSQIKVKRTIRPRRRAHG